MALTNYKPEFPYKGNQVIISSGRVLVHSKADSVLILGKKAVGVSTTGTFNVDATKGVTIAAPKIELGIGASNGVNGQPVIKGSDMITQLSRLLTQIGQLSDALSNLKSEPEGFAASLPQIVNQAKILSDMTVSIKNVLPGILSTVTYTL